MATCHRKALDLQGSRDQPTQGTWLRFKALGILYSFLPDEREACLVVS